VSGTLAIVVLQTASCWAMQCWRLGEKHPHLVVHCGVFTFQLDLVCTACPVRAAAGALTDASCVSDVIASAGPPAASAAGAPSPSGAGLSAKACQSVVQALLHCAAETAPPLDPAVATGKYSASACVVCVVHAM
jgi:hypothetical protein